MRHIRWYDKNPQLKDVFEFIETLDEDVQGKIAQDIFQILVNDFKFNLDEKFNEINKNCHFVCNRWYDNNIDLFSSFELIKTFSPQMQEEIVKKLVESILYIYLEENGVANG